MVTAHWYGLGLRKVATGTGPIIWSSDTIKVALLEDTYTPDQDADEFWDDISAHEASGDGYTAGGATLSGCTALAYDAENNRTALDANDVVWEDATVTAAFAVIYKDTSNASTSPLLGWVDLEGEESSSNGDFTISWDAGGILRIAAV